MKEPHQLWIHALIIGKGISPPSEESNTLQLYTPFIQRLNKSPFHFHV